MKQLICSMVLMAMGALSVSCVSRTCYLSPHDARSAVYRYESDGSELAEWTAIHGVASETECRGLSTTIGTYRTAMIRDGECPAHTESYLQTVIVTSYSADGLRARYGGRTASELVLSYDPLALGANPASSASTYCVYAAEPGLLELMTVGRVSPAMRRNPLAVPSAGSRYYQFPIAAIDHPTRITVSSSTTSYVSQDRVDDLATTIRDYSRSVERYRGEVGRLRTSLESSHAETAREHELNAELQRTIHEQAEALRRAGHELALSRSESARLRTRLQAAEAQIRTMIPRDVYEALLNQRAGQHEYEWAMGAFSQTVQNHRSRSGFCDAIMSSALGSLPGVLLSYIAGPEGVFANMAFEVIMGFLGNSLGEIMNPFVQRICH